MKKYMGETGLQKSQSVGWTPYYEFLHNKWCVEEDSLYVYHFSYFVYRIEYGPDMCTVFYYYDNSWYVYATRVNNPYMFIMYLYIFIFPVNILCSINLKPMSP